jgi:hypothetical protein
MQPPPGDPLEHHAAGLAKVICSAVFITGLDADFAAENVGYFTAPYAERAKLGRPVVDREAKRVTVTLPNGVVRTARLHWRSGLRRRCRRGDQSRASRQSRFARNLPDAAKTSVADG